MQEVKIGLRIKTRRNDLGLTQEELAQRMGYKSKSTINKIEKCLNDVSQSNVVKFANVLQTTEAYLMGWTDDPNRNLHEVISISKETMDNLLKTIPTSKHDYLYDHADDEAEIEEALKLYKQYKNAIPQIQSAVDSLLKSDESQP